MNRPCDPFLGLEHIVASRCWGMFPDLTLEDLCSMKTFYIVSSRGNSVEQGD